MGGHDEVALAVLRQTFDIGGIKDSVARRFYALSLLALATSESISGFVLAARPDHQTRQELARLTETLLTIPDAQLGSLQNGSSGFEAFESRLFDRIEAMRGFSAPFLDQSAD